MKNIANYILKEDFIGFAEAFDKAMLSKVDQEMIEFRDSLVSTVFSSANSLMEAARWKIVKARIRKGKVQRRVKVSNVAGFTFRKKGKRKQLVRMMPRERIKRKISQRRAKVKRKAKRSISRIKYKRSMRRRKGLGLK